MVVSWGIVHVIARFGHHYVSCHLKDQVLRNLDPEVLEKWRSRNIEDMNFVESGQLNISD